MAQKSNLNARQEMSADRPASLASNYMTCVVEALDAAS